MSSEPRELQNPVEEPVQSRQSPVDRRRTGLDPDPTHQALHTSSTHLQPCLAQGLIHLGAAVDLTAVWMDPLEPAK